MSAINMFFRVFSKDDSIMHKQFKYCRIYRILGGFKNCWIKSTVFLFSKINICFCSFYSTLNSVRLTYWFLYFVKLTILFVPLDLRIDQNHFVFNNHDYNDGSFNIQMLYELMKWLKYCTKMKYTAIPTTIWLFHAASKTKHDYYEINEIDHRKLSFHAYTLRIPWGLCFNECESSLTDYLYSVCVAMIAWMLFYLWHFGFFNFK